MRTFSFRPFLRSAIALVALACVAAQGTPVAAQSTPLIRLGTGPDQSVTPILYAISAGIYKKYGITVETVTVGQMRGTLFRCPRTKKTEGLSTCICVCRSVHIGVIQRRTNGSRASAPLLLPAAVAVWLRVCNCHMQPG